MAPFGFKFWETAFQTIPHIPFFDAELFSLDVCLGFVFQPQKIAQNWIKTNFKSNETNIKEYEYKVGDFMQIEDISKIAKLIQIKSRTKGLFQIGSSILELPFSKVLSVVENYNDQGVSSFKTDMETSNYELDLRGFSVIEVKDILEKFLDNSILNNEKSCQIYHGIGSRSIENEVHRILKETNFVAKFSIHNERKGVTVVSFK